MLEMCVACDNEAVERGLCDDCLSLYHTGAEERSAVVGAIMARRHPATDTDPWA